MNVDRVQQVLMKYNEYCWSTKSVDGVQRVLTEYKEC